MPIKNKPGKALEQLSRLIGVILGLLSLGNAIFNTHWYVIALSFALGIGGVFYFVVPPRMRRSSRTPIATTVLATILALGVLLAAFFSFRLYCTLRIQRYFQQFQLSGTATGGELRSLWKLASSTTNPCFLCLRQGILEYAFADPTNALNFKDHSDKILHAALGLNLELRRGILASVIERHCNITRDPDLGKRKYEPEVCLELLRAGDDRWRAKRSKMALQIVERDSAGDKKLFAELTEEDRAAAVATLRARLGKITDLTQYQQHLESLLLLSQGNLEDQQKSELLLRLLDLAEKQPIRIGQAGQQITALETGLPEGFQGKLDARQRIQIAVETLLGQLEQNATIEATQVAPLRLLRAYFSQDQKQRLSARIVKFAGQQERGQIASVLETLFPKDFATPQRPLEVAEFLTAPQRGALAQKALQALQAPEALSPQNLSSIATALFLLDASPAERQNVGEAIRAAIAERQNPAEILLLCQGLGALGEHLPQQVITGMVPHLQTRMQATQRPEDMELLLAGATSIQSRLSPQQKSELASEALRLISQIREPGALSSLIGKLLPLAISGTMPPGFGPGSEQAQLFDPLADRLVSALNYTLDSAERATISAEVGSLLEALAPLAHRLSPEAAANAWEPVLNAFPSFDPTGPIPGTYSLTLQGLAKSIGARSTLREAPFDLFVKTFRPTASPPCAAVIPLLSNARDPRVIDLLKWPTCPEQDRVQLVAKVARLAKLQNGDDLWSVMRWAEQQKLHPETPPEFPALLP